MEGPIGFETLRNWKFFIAPVEKFLVLTASLPFSRKV